jgi:hypothetical protein
LVSATSGIGTAPAFRPRNAQPGGSKEMPYYLVTIGEEDQPGGDIADELEAALERACEMSKRVKNHPQWDGADVRVWEASSGSLGPTLDRIVARFEDGKRMDP